MKTSGRSSTRAATRAAALTPEDYAARAGVSDEALKEKTGCPWARWVPLLDSHRAAEMAHRDIAELLRTRYEIDPWWAQAVTVGYERIKGLRARGQRRDGTYEVGRSRTYDVPVTALFHAWADARVRRRWLKGAAVKVRTAHEPTSMRVEWPDGTLVVVSFTAKGNARSSVAVQHMKLPNRTAADRLKEDWAKWLDVLRDHLAR